MDEQGPLGAVPRKSALGAIAGGALGTILGFAKRRSPAQYASTMAVNFAVASCSFFGVEALLTTATGATSSATTHAIAGSGAGSLLTGYVFGSARRAVLGGILFGAIGGCGCLGVEAFEEWRLRRGQEILAERRARGQQLSTELGEQSYHNHIDSMHLSNDAATTSTAHGISRRSTGSTADKKWPEWLPIRKLTDDEYAEAKEKQRQDEEREAAARAALVEAEAAAADHHAPATIAKRKSPRE